MRAIILATAALVTLAGCIQAPDDLAAEFEPASTQPPENAIEGMTAEATQTDSIVSCESDGLLSVTSACAERVLDVRGQVGIDALPVDLRTPNGQVILKPSEGDAWSFLATVRVRALTEDQAREGLDTAWAWSYEDGDGYALSAAPTGAAPSLFLPVGTHVEEASYEVSLPSWLLLDLTIRATNGGFVATGFDMGDVDVETTNGEIVLAGSAKNVRVDTTNGAILLALAPSATGTFELETTNGAIEVTLPEGRTRGYDIAAETTNGRIEIALKDGELREEGGPGSNAATFKSRDFSSRNIQTTMQLETTNGQIMVVPG